MGKISKARAWKATSAKPSRKPNQGSKRKPGRKVALARAIPEGGKPAKSDKIASMTVMLCRVKGASIVDLCKMTGWQPHSVRAAISATIKKKLKLDVVSEKVGGVRIYRVNV